MLLGAAFALLWAIVLGVALDYGGRRFFREPHRAAAMATIAGAAFFTGAVFSPARTPAPVDVAASAPAPSPTPATVAASCPAAVIAPSSHAVGNLDAVQDATTGAGVPSGASVARTRPLALTGWAASEDGRTAARGVCLAVDGKIVDTAVVKFGLSRPDVATALKNTALASSGFSITLPATGAAPGLHRLTIVVANDDGTRSSFAPPRTFAFR